MDLCQKIELKWWGFEFEDGLFCFSLGVDAKGCYTLVPFQQFAKRFDGLGFDPRGK